MAQWVEIISQILGAGGVLGFVSWVLFFKESKRLKAAEASKDELANLNTTLESLQKQVEFQGKQIDRLHEELEEERKLRALSYRQMNELQKKYNLKKLAINSAFSCDAQRNCPVLIKLKEIEENYLKANNNEINT